MLSCSRERYAEARGLGESERASSRGYLQVVTQLFRFHDVLEHQENLLGAFDVFFEAPDYLMPLMDRFHCAAGFTY